VPGYADTANLATNYFAVGHPSLTNYLEIVGGSNFGVVNDDSPAWHDYNCSPNIVSHVVADETATTNTCPIAGTGIDAATPAVDTTNEGTPQEPIYNTYVAPAPTVATAASTARFGPTTSAVDASSSATSSARRRSSAPTCACPKSMRLSIWRKAFPRHWPTVCQGSSICSTRQAGAFCGGTVASNR